MALVRFGSWFVATGSSSNKFEAQVSIYHMPYRLLFHCIFQEMLCYSFNDRIHASRMSYIRYYSQCSMLVHTTSILHSNFERSSKWNLMTRIMN